MNQPWTPRGRADRPDRLERRIEFDDYETTRGFLERLNNLCEQRCRFPDISFGRTYVNLTLRPDQDEAQIGDDEQAFAAAIDDLL